MAKLIVFPHLCSLNPPLAGVSAQAVAPSQDVRKVLAIRRRALDDYVRAQILSSAKAFRAGSVAAQTAAAPPYVVLEGVGALIIDEEFVDRLALATGLGARIYDNVRIPLVRPEPGAAVSAAAVAATGFWHLDSIRIQAAHDQGLQGRGVLVGVLDTGIDFTHPEFAGKPRHFQEFDSDGQPVAGPPRDAGDHGTHVCALIAGQTAGVAPAAELAVAAVVTLPGADGRRVGTFAQILAGLDWLVSNDHRGPGADPGVDLLNASLGTSAYDPSMHSAIANERLVNSTVFCAAIGNAGRIGVDHHGSPGNYDIALGIGAVDRSDRVADFSDWGTVPQHGGIAKPDLCAPGVEVLSAAPGGSYRIGSGTSMASSIAAGVCALLLQRTPALRSDAAGLTGAILSLTRPATPATRSCRGAIDLTAI